MQIFDNISSMQEWSLRRKQGNSIGLQPTMGYLHEGHRHW